MCCFPFLSSRDLRSAFGDLLLSADSYLLPHQLNLYKTFIPDTTHFGGFLWTTTLLSFHSVWVWIFFLFWRRRVSRKMHQCHAALGLRPHDFFLFSFLHYPGLNYHVTIMNPFRRQARLLWALSQALIHPAHQSRSSFFLLPFFQPLLVSFYLPETYNELHPVNSAEEERQHQSLLSSITMVFLSTSPIGRSDDGMLSYQKRLPGQEVFCKPSLTVQERTENEH